METAKIRTTLEVVVIDNFVHFNHRFIICVSPKSFGFAVYIYETGYKVGVEYDSIADAKELVLNYLNRMGKETIDGCIEDQLSRTGILNFKI